MRFIPHGISEWLFSFLRLGLYFLIALCLIIYMVTMPNSSYSEPFKPLSESELLLKNYLKKHVYMLAEQIGERNIWHYNELNDSAGYIETTLAELGYDVAKQEYKVENKILKNIEAELVGTSKPEEIIIVGAHYDSVIGSPGANDNASGVAAVLEIARLLSKEKLPRTLRMVAFVNEEPPFFQTKNMGSRIYAARSRQRGEKIIAMFSLETIGYYSNEPGSQHYPFPLGSFYPDTGNFIGFVGNVSSRKLVHHSLASFRRHTSFPSEGLAAPGWFIGIGWSDHWSFWKEGYPAVMITDTALFRYKQYHTMEDTPDKIDYDRMARVVEGITRVLCDLATTSGLPENG